MAISKFSKAIALQRPGRSSKKKLKKKITCYGILTELKGQQFFIIIYIFKEGKFKKKKNGKKNVD